MGPGSNPRARSSFRWFRGSAIMPISLPNASRMHSVACCLPTGSRRYRFPPPRRVSSFSLAGAALSPSGPQRPPTPSAVPCSFSLDFSQPFLRIDVIGLFALFRLRAGSSAILVMDHSRILFPRRAPGPRPVPRPANGTGGVHFARYYRTNGRYTFLGSTRAATTPDIRGSQRTQGFYGSL